MKDYFAFGREIIHFAFAREIVHQDSKLIMGSRNVESLFANVPFKDTINLCSNLLYKNIGVIEGINKSEMRTFYHSITLYLTRFFINKRTV